VEQRLLERDALEGHPLERHAVEQRLLERDPLEGNAMVGSRLGGDPVVGDSLVGGSMAVGDLGLSTPRPRARLERRVGGVIAAQLLIATLFAGLAVHRGDLVGRPLAVALLTVAFAVAGMFEMQLELRRHILSFTLVEAVVAIGLFTVGPLGLGIAAAAGEMLDSVASRRAPLKAAFNVSNRLAAATVAAVAFEAIGATDAHDPAAWAAALVAVLCFSLFDGVATAVVMSIAEQTRFHDLFVQSAGAGVLATCAATPVGLAAVALWSEGPLATLLLLPLVIAIACNSRYAVAQRDEHLRFERLYESLARSARLLEFDDALATLAAEARTLGTGTVAYCCAVGLDEVWHGAVADDHGCRRADDAAVAAAVVLAVQRFGREVERDEAPGIACFGADRALALSSQHESGRQVVVVVARAGSGGAARSRVETLEAFTHQAALIVSNAVLHEERAVALAREIDLNRHKSDFVAAVSHELRTPLGVMLGSVHTLERLRGRVSEEQQAQLFDMTLDQGRKLQRLIDELLLVAAAEHSQMPTDREAVDVNELFAAVMQSAAPPAADQIVQHCRIGPIVTDRSKLERILTNLVENARKYAPGGSVELHAAPIDGRVRFEVVDHGPGIPAEDRERVFERFVQLDQSSTRRQGGTGLGLHLCRQLAEVIDGELELTETPGGGCTFTLTITPAEMPDPIVRPFLVRERPREAVG
jgi:signal transduction histidine kinase